MSWFTSFWSKVVTLFQPSQRMRANSGMESGLTLDHRPEKPQVVLPEPPAPTEEERDSVLDGPSPLPIPEWLPASRLEEPVPGQGTQPDVPPLQQGDGPPTLQAPPSQTLAAPHIPLPVTPNDDLPGPLPEAAIDGEVSQASVQQPVSNDHHTILLPATPEEEWRAEANPIVAIELSTPDQGGVAPHPDQPLDAQVAPAHIEVPNDNVREQVIAANTVPEKSVQEDDSSPTDISDSDADSRPIEEVPVVSSTEWPREQEESILLPTPQHAKDNVSGSHPEAAIDGQVSLESTQQPEPTPIISIELPAPDQDGIVPQAELPSSGQVAPDNSSSHSVPLEISTDIEPAIGNAADSNEIGESSIDTVSTPAVPVQDEDGGTAIAATTIGDQEPDQEETVVPPSESRSGQGAAVLLPSAPVALETNQAFFGKPKAIRPEIPPRPNNPFEAIRQLMTRRVRRPLTDYQRALADQCCSSLERQLVLTLAQVFGDAQIQAWGLILQPTFSFFTGSAEVEGAVDAVLNQDQRIIVIEVDGERYHDPTLTRNWYLPSQSSDFRSSYAYQLIRQNALASHSHRFIRWCGAHFDQPDFAEVLRHALTPPASEESPALAFARSLGSQSDSVCQCLRDLGDGESLLKGLLQEVLGYRWLAFLHAGNCNQLDPVFRHGIRPTFALLCGPAPVALMIDRLPEAPRNWYANLLTAQNRLTLDGWLVLRFLPEALERDESEQLELLARYAVRWHALSRQTNAPVAPLLPARATTERDVALRLLRSRRIAEFNTWRERRGWLALNLIQADLQGAFLAGVDLRGCVVIGANFVGADLRNARLDGLNFYRSRLEGADLSGAHLEAADLSMAIWGGTDPARMTAAWPRNRFLLPREDIEITPPSAVNARAGNQVLVTVTLHNRGEVPKQVTLTLVASERELARRQVEASVGETPIIQLEGTLSTPANELFLCCEYRTLGAPRRDLITIPCHSPRPIETRVIAPTRPMTDAVEKRPAARPGNNWPETAPPDYVKAAKFLQDFGRLSDQDLAGMTYNARQQRRFWEWLANALPEAPFDVELQQDEQGTNARITRHKDERS